MPFAEREYWCEKVRGVLGSYDLELLRQVSARLFKPRNQWPAEELVERCLANLDNAASIDRRLQDLSLPSRRALAFMAHSRQPRWRLGNLLELLAAVGHAEGPQPVLALLEAGLVYPDWSGAKALEPGGLKSFEQWLGQAATDAFAVFVHPQVMTRALGADLGLPCLPVVNTAAGGVHEADGLEWPLRLAAAWQLLIDTPLRKTQQGDFFKRDLDRLQADALLNAPPAESLGELPDPSLLAVELAQIEQVVRGDHTELHAGVLPAIWDAGLPATLASLWLALGLLESWNPRDGWRGGPSIGNPYPSAYLLALLLLAQAPDDAWMRPEDVERWLLEHHPFWQGQQQTGDQTANGLAAFLLGLAFPLRLIQAARDTTDGWAIRLSGTGRWLLGLGPSPVATPAPSQTLLVQPNLEVIAYRQGLTPVLIGRLTRFARWKSLGPACTLQLEAAAIYRGLESGLSFEAMLQLLETHGMRATPAAVIESLRTWADKRERISIYPSGTLFEFNSAEDLNEALARGLPGVRLSERLLVVGDESAIDFRHFRLTGTRDYGLPPEKCVDVDDDGVTLSVDLTRSDLLLETELQRFAERIDTPSNNGRRRYRLTPESLAGGRAGGMGAADLDDWFVHRTGQMLSAAARLLLDGSQVPAPQLRQQLVLHVATPELADGLCQWPGTRALIQERLGAKALAVAAEDVETLCQRLASLGVTLTR